ncbi:MAG: SMC-Scp complex subunit ScpB [Candidatus Bathyarchaeota archaeon]|nr:SMC-Scp complex subunit ScpB [Candidatus Bathyarchaeota archaeon]MDH5595401.1 SMC-Scp complex subunit ScpB [Candidatus Bathyarchaeota archaeon]
MEQIERNSSELLSEEKLKRNLALLEAALYVAGRSLDLRTLGSIIKTRSKRKVQRLVGILMEEYKNRETALEILELEDERFVLQLKGEYSPQVQRLAIRPLLSKGPLKTLSYIAYRQPVLQSQVVDVRGHHAYGHLRQLESMGLISRERVGRTRLLRTTGFFADYFGLSHDLRTMKRQLKRVFEDFEKAEVKEK